LKTSASVAIEVEPALVKRGTAFAIRAEYKQRTAIEQDFLTRKMEHDVEAGHAFVTFPIPL
jgi:hypothetical protein